MNRLIQLAADYDITVTPEQIEQFQIYSDFLLDYNEKVNLTAIREEEEVITKHFLDSLFTLDAYDIPDNAKVIDIGTGAGFPGIPMKIVRPDIQLTLLDSLNKRIVFLELLEEKLGLDNELIHGRAEHFALEENYREQYDVVVSRAVANLASLSEYCLPFVEVGGMFLALKGPSYDEELQNAQDSIYSMGGEFVDVACFELPDGDERNILLIEKIDQTPPNFPRQGINIVKNPL